MSCFDELLPNSFYPFHAIEKRNILSSDKGKACFFIHIILFLFISGNAFGQCDTAAVTRKVMDAVDLSEFVIDIDSRFTIRLKASLDQRSLKTIREGLAKPYFVRQTPLNGKFGFDTLFMTDTDRKELDSIVAHRTFVWKDAKEASCKLNRKFVFYKRIPDEDLGVSIPRVQIMEPVLIRNNTIAFIFYQAEPIMKYGELSIYTLTGNGWKRWDRIIILLD
ncbi:MAG: hypothetical protein NTW29_18080 [Bacteroidetes bacterium]|nr:hypothetical protein [Bacteroidota bacterium]